jgi:hypothetical protein
MRNRKAWGAYAAIAIQEEINVNDPVTVSFAFPAPAQQMLNIKQTCHQTLRSKVGM